MKMDPQTSTANQVPNISNITSSMLHPLGITSEQVAAIANIVMAVQNQNIIPSPSSTTKLSNASGTIKVQRSRQEKSPRKRVLVVRVHSLLYIKEIDGFEDCCQAPYEFPAEDRT